MSQSVIVPEEMELVYAYPASLTRAYTHYCPGCVHGIVHRLVAEVIDELGIRERAIGVAPVGCAVLIYNYINTDFVEAAHGRAPAMATGIKRVNPDNVVFTYQGDGDLAAIGTAEIIHAANRGERITTVFINNAIYGMTGARWLRLRCKAWSPRRRRWGVIVSSQATPYECPRSWPRLPALCT